MIQEATLGQNEDQQTSNLFNRIRESDPGITDPNKVAQIIFLQTSLMRATLSKYPSVLYVDTTYKINTRSMPLFSIMLVNGNRNGQVAGFGLVINECSETITKLLQTLVEYNEFCKEEVKTTLIDKDFAEVNAVKNALPNSDITCIIF